MKKWFTFLFLTIGVFVLIGCGAKEYTTGEIIEFDKTQVKDTILTVWMDDTDGVYMDEIIPAFEAANPGITVEFQHMATVDAREKLKTFGQSGYGADVFQFPHDHMAQAILDDLVYVLPDELMTRLESRVQTVAMDIATSCYDASTGSFECAAGSSKKLFAVPISIESVTIFYNKALVSSDMLPTSFEDFLADAAAYTANDRYFGTSSHWADAYFLQFIYSAFGWTPFGENLNDATEVGFEDQAVVDALNWMMTNLKPVVTGNGNHDSVAATSLFEEGKLPFILAGPWQINTFRDADIDFGSITIPTINGQETSTFAGAQMAAVYKYSENKEAAIKFVEFLASDEAAEILYRTSGDCPALTSEILSTIPGLKDDEVMQVMLKQLETSVPMPTIPEVTYYWGPAETMVKSIWNSQGVITDAVKTAEKSYKAARDLAS
ncbi:MAG: extracellular solute-binding protein [Bacilli bacterium]|nr:extracellular solute-binding protein [Bacilli bacterium]